MKCLVVGGTGFMGGAMAEAALAAGHDVTILSRGQTKSAAQSRFKTIIADRSADLNILKNHSFDYVFDSCAYTPDMVERLLDAVGDIKRYALISSVSAYGDFSKKGLTELAPVPDATAEDIALAASIPPEDRASAAAYGSAYGRLKRACEKLAEARLGERATSLRLGLIVGAGDYTDRLTWWVRRFDEKSGENAPIPAPLPRNRPVQIIDVRDAAEFALRCAEHDLGGIWNVTGEPLSFDKLLQAIGKTVQSSHEIHWIAPDIIIAAGIKPWSDMPLMAPELPEFRHFLEIDTRKARAAGLTFRPLEATLNDLATWDRTRRDMPMKVGLTSAQEAEIVRLSSTS